MLIRSKQSSGFLQSTLVSPCLILFLHITRFSLPLSVCLSPPLSLLFFAIAGPIPLSVKANHELFSIHLIYYFSNKFSIKLNYLLPWVTSNPTQFNMTCWLCEHTFNDLPVSCKNKIILSSRNDFFQCRLREQFHNHSSQPIMKTAEYSNRGKTF